MNHQFVPHTNPKLSYYAFESEKASFKVFPNLGGSLLDWSLEGIEVLTPFPISEEGIHYYETFYPSSLLFPFPNRIDGGTFSHEGKQYELPINDVLFGNAIHGCISKSEFEVETLRDHEISLKHLHLANDNFPFDFQLKISYEFSDEGVCLHIEVQNLDTKSFPFGLGWHPYFNLENDTRSHITFNSNITYITNDRMIPLNGEAVQRRKILLEHAQLDTAFALIDPMIILSTQAYTLTMNVQEFNFLQLFIPENRKSIAMEPMTCIANSFNNGIGKKVLSPKDTFQTTLQISCSIKS